MLATLKRAVQWITHEEPVEAKARAAFQKATTHYGPPDRFNRNPDGTYVCPLIESEWLAFLDKAISEDIAW